jgi:hypothetical protein
VDAFRAERKQNNMLYFALFLQCQTDQLAKIRCKLLQFLQTSQLYTPEIILDLLQQIHLVDVEACVVLARASMNGKNLL